MVGIQFKCKIQSILILVLYFAEVPALGMWKTADNKILTSFQHKVIQNKYINPKQTFIHTRGLINRNEEKMGPEKRPNIFRDVSNFKRSIKVRSLGPNSTNVANNVFKSWRIQKTNPVKEPFTTFSQEKSELAVALNPESLGPAQLNFNQILKKVEKIILENLNDKDVKNQLCALNSINLFSGSDKFMNKFLKGGLLSTLLGVLEKPYQKNIWKLVNTYIWPNKPMQTPELLTVQELVLKILISLSSLSEKNRTDMIANESLKKTLLKIYLLYGQLDSQEGGNESKEETISSSEKDKVKGLIDELFLTLGYKVDKKIILLPSKPKEPDSKEESWTWDKIVPFSSSEENGSTNTLKDYLIPVKSNRRTSPKTKRIELCWVPYFSTSADSKDALLRNIRINLGEFDRIEGLDNLENLTLKPSKAASKNPEMVGLLAVNLNTVTSKSDAGRGKEGTALQILSNINIESSEDLNLGVVTERLFDVMRRTTDFRILNDIFTELWSLLALKSEELLGLIHSSLDLDLVADIVNYSCFNFESDKNSTKTHYLPTDVEMNEGVSERPSNIFGRLSRLTELVKDHFEKSPKGSIQNLLYNFLTSNMTDNSKLSVDLDEISTRIDKQKSGQIEKFKNNTVERAKVLQMTLFGFLVELIYVDGKRSFTKIRDHERFINAVKNLQKTLKEPVYPEAIKEEEKEHYIPLIDKRMELKSVSTNVVTEENINQDYSPFNTYKRMNLNGIDFLDIRLNSWKKQKQCLREDLGAIYNSNKLLNLLGYHEPKNFQNRGVRILSIDGGGSKGVIALEILSQLYKEIQRPLHECFDLICGTSTGGLLASLIALEKMEISEIQKLYDSLIKSIFMRDSYHVTGTRLIMKQAIYDDNTFRDLLKTSLEDIELIDYSVDRTCPKFFCVSTQMDVTPLRPIIWRNYNYHKDIYTLCSREGYTFDDVNKLIELNAGSCTIKLREAIKATTAAPVYFPLLERNGHLYGDGALYCNNPAVVSLTEAKLLFPGTPIDLLLSVGNGISKLSLNGSTQSQKSKTPSKDAAAQDEASLLKEQEVQYIKNLVKLYENSMDHGLEGTTNGKKEVKNLTLEQLFTHLTYAVTTSEMTHSALELTMPKEIYYRFSPIVSSVKIDETNPDVLNTLKAQTRHYLMKDHIKAKFNQIRELLNKGN